MILQLARRTSKPTLAYLHPNSVEYLFSPKPYAFAAHCAKCKIHVQCLRYELELPSRVVESSRLAFASEREREEKFYCTVKSKLCSF